MRDSTNISRARLTRVLTIVLVAANRPAWPQDGLNAETMKLYGGTYLSDCKNPASPRVTVFKDS